MSKQACCPVWLAADPSCCLAPLPCRYAQELLLQKDISLVLNVKHELLERVARCTGALVRTA